MTLKEYFLLCYYEKQNYKFFNEASKIYIFTVEWINFIWSENYTDDKYFLFSEQSEKNI